MQFLDGMVAYKTAQLHSELLGRAFLLILCSHEISAFRFHLTRVDLNVLCSHGRVITWNHTVPNWITFKNEPIRYRIEEPIWSGSARSCANASLTRLARLSYKHRIKIISNVVEFFVEVRSWQSGPARLHINRPLI